MLRVIVGVPVLVHGGGVRGEGRIALGVGLEVLGHRAARRVLVLVLPVGFG